MHSQGSHKAFTGHSQGIHKAFTGHSRDVCAHQRTDAGLEHLVGEALPELVQEHDPRLHVTGGAATAQAGFKLPTEFKIHELHAIGYETKCVPVFRV